MMELISSVRGRIGGADLPYSLSLRTRQTVDASVYSALTAVYSFCVTNESIRHILRSKSNNIKELHVNSQQTRSRYWNCKNRKNVQINKAIENIVERLATLVFKYMHLGKSLIAGICLLLFKTKGFEFRRAFRVATKSLSLSTNVSANDVQE